MLSMLKIFIFWGGPEPRVGPDPPSRRGGGSHGCGCGCGYGSVVGVAVPATPLLKADGPHHRVDGLVFSG